MQLFEKTFLSLGEAAAAAWCILSIHKHPGYRMLGIKWLFKRLNHTDGTKMCKLTTIFMVLHGETVRSWAIQVSPCLPFLSLVEIMETGSTDCWRVYCHTDGDINSMDWYTLWLFNIAVENGPFIDVFPIKTSIYKGFSMAMLNNQMEGLKHV